MVMDAKRIAPMMEEEEAIRRKRKWKSQRRRKRKSKSLSVSEKKKEVASISEDVTWEILRRLPLESLVRLRGVFPSIVQTHDFSNVLSTRVLVAMMTDDPRTSSLHSAPLPRPPQPTDLRLDRDHSVPDMRGIISGIARGFICFEFKHRVRIYNPTTRQLVTLPPLPEISGPRPPYVLHLTFFAHDPLHDRFVVLHSASPYHVPLATDPFQRPDFNVLVVGPGCSWRRVASPCRDHYFMADAKVIGGVIYYGAWDREDRCVVVSFDVSCEKFGVIELPEKAGNVWKNLGTDAFAAELIEHEGKLGVVQYSRLWDTGRINVWLLEDAETHRWSNKLIALPEEWREYFRGQGLSVRGCIGNRELVLCPERLPRDPYFFISYDLLTNTARRVVMHGVPMHKYQRANRFFFVITDYVESLLHLHT